jgi:ribonuclease HI
VKVNTDAAFQATEKNGASACVIRDQNGAVQEAQAMCYEQVFDACTMEALACRDGIKMAEIAGYQHVQLETDCLELVQLWKVKESQRSIVRPVLEEIYTLSRVFQEFSFSYINRNCNKVAHVLAKQVSDSHRLERWHVTPACVSDLVLFEASAG